MKKQTVQCKGPPRRPIVVLLFQKEVKMRMNREEWNSKNFARLLKSNQRLSQTIKKAEKQKIENVELMFELIYPCLAGIYQEWFPQLEEDIVMVDLENEAAFSGKISHVKTNLLQAHISQLAYYSISLPLDSENYGDAKFIIPQSCYAEFQELFGEVQRFGEGTQEILKREIEVFKEGLIL